ncbi:MAG: GAP family protein [Thermoleophilaceae bacterium]|nr:GAP family protein [Thermoleophilaceae bacterium]
MLQVLGVVVPLGLAGAVSPVMLTEQTVLLSGPDGRRVAGGYAAGAALTLLVFTSILVVFGRAIPLPEEPHLDASLDLVLGALLLALAVVLRLRRPRERKPHAPPRELGPGAALAFGVASMATNITTLALVIPAAKEIAASDLGVASRAVLVIALVGLASTPAWSPVALTEVAPGPAERALRAFADLIKRRGRLLTVVCLVAFGALLALRGIIRLVSL